MRFSKVTHLACACALVFSTLSPLQASNFDSDVRFVRTSAPSSHGRPEVQVELTEADDKAQEAASGVRVKKRPNLFVRIISAPFRGLAKLFGGGKSDKTARVKANVNKKQEPQATNTTTAPAANNANVASANTANNANVSQANIANVPQANDAATANNVNIAQANTENVAQPNVTNSVQTSATRDEPARTQSQPASVAESAAHSVRAGEKTASAPPVVAAAAPPASVIATPSAAVTASPSAASKADGSFDYEPRRFTPYIEGVAGDPLSQGRALLANGYTNEAIAELSIAAVTGPDLVEANNLLGLAYDRRGQHKQAREFYERALSVAPHTARVINNLGHSFYLDDRNSEALAQLKLAARLAPADTQVANNLALVYGRLCKYDNAFKEFKRAGGEFYARTRTAAILAAAGRDRDAIKHYEAARKLDPASSDVLRQLITLYVRTGQREKAEAAERLLEKTPATTGAATIS